MSLLTYFGKSDESEPPAKKRKITETKTEDIPTQENKNKENETIELNTTTSDNEEKEGNETKKDQIIKSPSQLSAEEKKKIEEQNKQRALQIRQKKTTRKEIKCFITIPNRTRMERIIDGRKQKTIF